MVIASVLLYDVPDQFVVHVLLWDITAVIVMGLPLFTVPPVYVNVLLVLES